MNASKENARKAREAAKRMSYPSNAAFIDEFLQACERKLPTEAAYKRDRQRRKQKV